MIPTSQLSAPQTNRFQAILMACVLGLAPFPVTASSQTEPDRDSRFEIGVSTGFPSLTAFEVGYWGADDFPLVARAALGVGSHLDIGIHLPAGKSPENRLFLAASAGALGYFDVLPSTLVNVGPTVGARLGNFFAQGGPCVYFSGSSSQFAGYAQLGFSFFY